MFAIEVFVFDEVDVGAEPGNDRALLVTMTDALASVGELAGVETTVGAPDAAEILDFRFPHGVGRWIERAQLEGLPVPQGLR